MSTPTQPPTPDTAGPSAPPRKTLRVRTQDVRLGMFVTELDRPWLETPFLFQGFVVGNEAELETLRKHCEHVYIDRSLSEPAARLTIDVLLGLSPDESQHATAAAARPQGGAHANRVATVEPRASVELPAAAQDTPPDEFRYPARTDAPVSRETRSRFRSLLQSNGIAEPVEEDSVARRALARLRSMLKPSVDSGGDIGAATAVGRPDALPGDLLALLPPGTALGTYADAHDVATELPRARQAMAACEEVLTTMTAEVRAGRPVGVAALDVGVARLVTSAVANPDALAWAVRLREEAPQGQLQSLKVAVLMVSTGRQMGLPRELLTQLGAIGLLADLGKARLPRALLDKPGQLEPAEYAVAKGHVQLGLDLLRQSARLPEPVVEGIAQHHERLDGSGYPKGLRGGEIGLLGRIAGIADSFAAISAPRAYANPMSPQDALMGLFQWSGNLYDRSLVAQFIRAIGVFPVGSLVELSSGEVAIVLALDRSQRLEPRLLVLTRPDKRPLAEPVELQRTAGRAGDDMLPRIANGLPSGAFGLRIRDYYLEIA